EVRRLLPRGRQPGPQRALVAHAVDQRVVDGQRDAVVGVVAQPDRVQRHDVGPQADADRAARAGWARHVGPTAAAAGGDRQQDSSSEIDERPLHHDPSPLLYRRTGAAGPWWRQVTTRFGVLNVFHSLALRTGQGPVRAYRRSAAR